MTYLSSMHTSLYSPAIGGLEQMAGYQGSISTLETAVRDYAPHRASSFSAVMPAAHCSGSDYGNDHSNATQYGFHAGNYSSGYLINSAREYFTPIMFLKTNRPASLFIGKSDDIKHYVMEAFEATAGMPLPDDITISIVTKDELRQKHDTFGGEWSEGIQGFAINRKGVSHSMIFVKENDLDQLLLVIGHEIGHCMSRTLPSKLDEEAKAFAFELAWMDALAERDIAGMKHAIDLDPRPANNGLHNVAFNFVKRLVKQGKKAMHLFQELVTRNIVVGEQDVR